MIKLLKNYPKTTIPVLLILFVFGISYLHSLSESGYGEKAFAADPEQEIDPKTLKLLKEMTQFISLKNNYTFKAEIMYDNIAESGQSLQVTASEKVFLEKPNKAYIEYNGDYSAHKFLYNSDKVTLLDSSTNLYSQVKATDTINSTFDRLAKVYEFIPPLIDFFYSYPYNDMIANVKSSTYVGTSVVFGVRCNHLAFEEEDKDWQIWIEQGNRKIPRKLVIKYKNLPGSPQFIAIIRDWIFNEPLPATLFNQDLTKNSSMSDKNLFYKKSANNFGVIREF